MKLRRILIALTAAATFAFPAAANITSTSLRIQGAGLTIADESKTVTTGIDMPATVQTVFGGKTNDEAVALEGVVAVGELTGPGLETPIQLATAPGHKFQIPGLPQLGTYYLQNVRLMKGTEFLQYATPAVATIQVADLLQTKVTVKQLSPEELRARGITIDSRNFDVYEYTFTFIVNGQEVKIPFPVAIDPKTHQAMPIAKETPYVLPSPKLIEPPRWTPPQMIPTEFVEEGDLPENGTDELPPDRGGTRPSIPAAIVIPNSLAVLHHFFAVGLMVTNGAPTGSTARLEDIHATIRIPTALRTVKTTPSVAFGQAVPVVEPTTGVTFLIAQSRGEAEWILEGLQSGTHRLDFDLRATLKQPGQEDIPMKATPSASIVIHDPRFNITFSHPDTVRKGIEYSTYAFVTNMSADPQTITVSTDVQPCDVNPNANACRLNGQTTDLLTIPAGDMRVVEYRLRPGITGNVFATAGTISNDEVLSASVKLTMGVSESGIPLSPATLIMPYYAQFADPDVVAANLQLFGLGYSLATAPLNAMTAKFPRVIKTDVFQRAVDVSRAGQRIFITDSNPAQKRDAYSHLVLDLLGNGGVELREWDSLRRQEKSGRGAGASVVRQLEATGLTNGTTITSFADTFASVTAHRQGYLAAFAHGAATGTRPYAISIAGRTTTHTTDIPNEADSGWKRDIPFSDISRFNGSGENGELAIVGRWTEDFDVKVTPAADGNFSIDLIYPHGTPTDDGKLLRAHFDVVGAHKDVTITIPVARGAQTMNAFSGSGIAAVATVTTVNAEALRIAGARQDLHLDEEGHKVSLLYNRPVKVPDGLTLSTNYKGTIDFNRDNVVYNAPRPISAAALQVDDRTVNITFDHALSVNATYLIESLSLIDPLTSAQVSFPDKVAPKIDNDNPAGIVYGHVVKGDNSAIGGAEVILRQYRPNDTRDPSAPPQYDLSRASDGAFLFEYVRRQTDAQYTGAYRLEATAPDGKHTQLEAAVRLPGRVHTVTLQFLGRGAAEGYVRYNDGSIVAGAKVVIGSTMFDQFRSATADSTGHYRIEDLPVGPLTFSATDDVGNVTFAANEIATPGQLVTQNLSIFRKPFPGNGRVYGTVRRSDTQAPVAGAHVGVYSQGYGLIDAFTDSDGRFDFPKVPSGFVTLLASEWSVSRTATSSDFDLRADEVRQMNLLLAVVPTEKSASLTGVVWREKPLQPGQYERVPGALVKIDNYRIVTANASGEFTYDEIPVSFTGRGITAYDPETKRVKNANVPTLAELPAANSMTIFINASDRGTGTIRVRLLNSAGNPVPGYRVIVPGYPPDVLHESSAGVYELKNVPVGVGYNIWAVPSGQRPPSGTPDPRPYGDQLTSGSSKAEFNGHVAALTLRLPGQGTVRVKVRSQFDLITPVNLTYSVWDEQEQGTQPLTLTESTVKNGEADYAVFTAIPALQGYNANSAHPQYGYASVGAQLTYDGALNTHTLQLNTLATVRGQVYAIDGVTPIAGASVTIYNGRSDPGPQITGPDGRFEFRDQPSSIGVTVTAQVTQSGIYRTGYAVAYTPPNGGSVDNMAVVLRKRGFVDGRVVYKDYKKYDPANPANNIPDNTPNDYSDNAPVPLAKFYLRELDFPYRPFGKNTDPLTADITGHFVLSNIFVGAVRATAWDPGNEELRGDWQGSIDEEGAEALPKAYIAVTGGGGGVGGAIISVVDPNQSFQEVANAEVSVYRGGGRAFDFGSTDATGKAEFSQLPVGSYTISAYSKALGKTSRAKTINVVANGIAVERLELEFSGVVDGTFTDPEANHKPIPGAIVRLTAPSYTTQSSTDVNGFFLFNGVREGSFSLDAKDTESNRRAHRDNSLSVLDPHRTVNLELEPTETLYVQAYLPSDTGSSSGILAPPVTVEVTQRCTFNFNERHCDYLRELQGNPVVFSNMFKNSGYGVTIKEIGGLQRVAGLGGTFPAGTQSNPLTYTWPAYGDVNVTVTQAGVPAAGAKVTVSGSNTNVTVYTDSAGQATARGLQLGGVYVQATSVDGRFNGSTSTAIQRSSVPATASIALGSYAGVTGRVFTEADGSPSVGTIVVAFFGGNTAQIRTDAEGRYTILGIPTTGTNGTGVNLTFIGPDDTTVGGYRSKTVFANSGVANVDDIRLDATAPTLESILPADGALAVSPDTNIVITFSETLNTNTIHSGTFQLVDADGATVGTNITWQSLANGKFAVTMTPPHPATGFPLRSNTLYRVVVSSAVTDTTGHGLPATRGFSFTTSDYAEPRVQKVLPASPIPRETTFEFRFNEPIDPNSWKSGGNGVFHIYKIAAPGGANAPIIRELSGRAFTDPETNMSLFIAPGDNDPIEPESFYRVYFSGVRDPQGNVTPEQTYYFYSFDEIDPYVVFTAPAASEQLVSGSEYELRIELHNGSTTGSTATDVAKVDYFTVAANGTETPFAAVTKAPFYTKVLGPEAPESGATYTVGAQATDTSGRRGPKATASWTVKPNQPPRNVVVTASQSSAYPSNKVSASVVFEDEGSFASVTTTFTVPLTNGTTSVPVTKTQSYTRNANGTWPAVLFTFDLPVTAQPGSNATFSATVADVRGLTSTPVTATTTVAEDLIQPQILTVTPPPNTTYFKDNLYTIDAVVKDNETTVQSVTFLVDGEPVAVASSTTDGATGRQTFHSVSVKVPPKADDTKIPIVVTAKDYNNNTRSTSFEITYKGVNDPEAPKVTWLCPIDRAAIPADLDNFQLKLRISAVDQDVVSVTFATNGSTPVTATGARDNATAADWTGTLNFTKTPSPGTIVITATVKDTISTHTVDLPVTLDVLRYDKLITDAQAIIDTNVAQFQGKSVALVGTNAVLAPQLPVSFENLLVLNGARVETLPTTILKEYKVDFTVTGVTFVDCDSSINESEKGYVGGWQNTTDGRNNDPRGRTAGNTSSGGADSGSQGSYAGLGGNAVESLTNAVYGSIVKPVDLGSGGGGSIGCCNNGAPGGGAISLQGGTGENDASRIVIAGTVRATGGAGLGNPNANWAAGSGGSIWLQAKQVLFGSRASVIANGGDDDGSNPGSWGGGGGRVSITATTKLDASTATIEARGGRNYGQPETKTVSDGGAGTIFIRKPGQDLGELTVSSYDSRFPSTTHNTRPTPIGRIGRGTSTAVGASSLTDSTRTFDKWMIGEELFLAGNTTRSFTVTGISADSKSLLTDPADGSLLTVATSQAVAYEGATFFDKVIAGKRALLRFDDRASSAGLIDDVSGMTVDPTAAVVFLDDKPTLTFTSTPAEGGNVVLDTTLSTTYSVTSTSGVRSVTLTWTPETTPRVDTYNDYPTTTTSKTVALTVPSTTPLGPATLTIKVVDRAGRTYTCPVKTYNITANSAPVIDSYTVAPPSLYAGHDVVATLTAHDDIAVKTITFDAKLNGTSIKTGTFTPNTPTVTQAFTVSIPKETAGGSTLTIDASVSDGFAGRAATTGTQTPVILTDSGKPAISVIAPAAGATTFKESAKFNVHVTATDTEVAVKEVYVQINGGAAIQLPQVSGTSDWRGDVTVPPVDGDQDVQANLTISAKDYAGNVKTTDPIVLTFQPVIDSNAPVLSWSCTSPGAMVPAGNSIKLRAIAAPANAQNPVQSVEMYIDDSTTSLTVTSLGGNQYEATYPVPSATTDGTVVRARVIARSAGGATSDLLTTFTVVVPDVAKITGNTTIDTTTTTYDNKTLVIEGGTVTIRGPHTFDRLLLLGGTIVHNNLEKVEITTTRGMYVACGATIDTTGRGYQNNASYPDAQQPYQYIGGSHIGLSTFGITAAAYGSVYRPQEHGGGAYSGSAGGGVVRIKAGPSVAIDGALRANGQDAGDRSGAGGSIYISTGKITGSGSLEARGGNVYYEKAGGGAIAIEYTDAASTLPPSILTRGGQGGTYYPGGAGTLYVKGPSSTYGDVTLDANGISSEWTDLPSLGSGSVVSVSGNSITLDRPANVPVYFEGHWVEIKDANGAVKGTWRIDTVTPNTKTVTLKPNSTETISIVANDKWQGVYLFDNVRAWNGAALKSNDPIRTTALDTVGNPISLNVITTNTATIRGTTYANTINATTITVDTTGVLRQSAVPGVLTLNTQTLTMKGAIDVTGQGYQNNVSYPGAVQPYQYIAGSHIGASTFGIPGVTFGSVYHPREAGGGAFSGSAGGGVVRINATNLVALDGVIRANGVDSGDRSGAGGSVWITTGKITGAGSIEVRGGNVYYEKAGGGAVSIEYTDPTSVLPGYVLRGGTGGTYYAGGSGSFYTKGPSQQYGDITFDSNGYGSEVSDLPSLGAGSVVSVNGNTITLDRSANIPVYFEGHWVEIKNATGTVKGMWRIDTVTPNSKIVTLKPNGTETISIAAGDKWQGVYMFDTLRMRNNAYVKSGDPIRTTNFDEDGDTTIPTPIVAQSTTIRGTLWASAITGNDLTIETGGVLRQSPAPGTLTIDVQSLTVKGSIDATGRGYQNNTSYPSAQQPFQYIAGSHIGASTFGQTAANFGSIYRPQENGGGAYSGSAGGGVIRIKAPASVTLDGVIRANGQDSGDRSGAGGSVWITTGKISGAGSIEVRGGNVYYEKGGGGAVAIEYNDATSTLPAVITRGGIGGTYYAGGTGSFYSKGPGQQYGELTFDGNGYSSEWSDLPSLGSGSVVSASGATITLDRTANIPAYFEGHWVDIKDATGTLKGTWRIDTVTPNTKTITLKPNGTETISIVAGDKWQGVYLLDVFRLKNSGYVRSSDPIRATTFDVPSGEGTSLPPVTATNTNVKGTIWATSITGNNLTVESGGLLRQADAPGTLLLDMQTVNVKGGGAIDASTRGYQNNASHPSAGQPYQYVGGSHIGVSTGGRSGLTFGSIYRPQESGGGAYSGSAGGGAVRIKAATSVTVDGAIRSNGADSGDRSGAGGSVWITTAKISGAGSIEVRGGNVYYEKGGGGAIALEYTDATSTFPSVITRGGTTGTYYAGGAGSFYVKGPSSTYGDVTFDASGLSSEWTELPSLGRGNVVSVNGAILTLDRASIPSYFEGHWVRISAPNGTERGTWRIAKVAGSDVTLTPNGSETISAQPGDGFRGVYSFDKMTIRNNASIRLLDDVRATIVKEGSGNITINDPPFVNPAAISTQSRPDGDFVVGTAGAVNDLHPPISVVAMNKRTGVISSAVNAASDGSFLLSVSGLAGDTFAVRATDSYGLPATSAWYDVSGAITAVNGVASVTLQPSTANGGTPITASVRMIYPVRPGLGVVTLTSSNAAATVPATVTVPDGANSVQFTINTSTVSSDTAITITAANGAASKSATLNLLGGSSAVTQVTLTPDTIEGGTSINGTVVLGGPAPAEGALVSLATSDTRLASVQATVVVPAGATSAAFTVTTFRVPAQSTVSVNATYGATKSASATLSACSGLSSVSQPSISPLAQTWVDDSAPSANITGDGALDSTQSASGASSIHLSGAAGVHTYAFTGATTPLAVTATDRLVVYALINPCNPPREILIGWKAGTSDYRAAWGEQRIEPAVSNIRIGPMPEAGQWVRLEVFTKTLGIAANTSLTDLSIRTLDGEAWFDVIGKAGACSFAVAAPPAVNPNEVVWFDDDLPAGAFSDPETSTRHFFTWDNAQKASGTRSHRESLQTGLHEHAFYKATDKMYLGQGDVLFTYVLIDPCNPPKEIMLAFFDGSSWEHRAYWGESAYTGWGNEQNGSRMRMGPLPEAGKWVRLEVPASFIGLSGSTIEGAGFALFDGQAWFDRTGKMARVNLALNKTATQSSDYDVTRFPASRAVDGNLNGNSNAQAMSIAQIATGAWWQVDLGSIQPISTIDIRGRTDCCPDQTQNFWVLVSNDPIASNNLATAQAQPGVTSYAVPGQANSLLQLSINRSGRYVRIQLGGNNYLSLTEVQVWAPAGDTRVNLAGGSTPTMSAEVDSASRATNAVNGALNDQRTVRGSTASTCPASGEAWWDLDLGSLQTVSALDVFVRNDCCTDSLRNTYMFLSPTPMPASKTSTDTFAQSDVIAYYTGTRDLPVLRYEPGKPVRYIRIVKTDGVNCLQMSEVQVWAQQPTLKPLSAPAPTH
jgi:hypothetical protein